MGVSTSNFMQAQTAVDTDVHLSPFLPLHINAQANNFNIAYTFYDYALNT
jgi:hypothetical protein